MRQLAAESAAQDAPSGGKFAIVAPDALAFGLGRAYQTYREQDPRTKKQVGVFSNLRDALDFLGIDDLGPPPNQPTGD